MRNYIPFMVRDRGKLGQTCLFCHWRLLQRWLPYENTSICISFSYSGEFGRLR